MSIDESVQLSEESVAETMLKAIPESDRPSQPDDDEKDWDFELGSVESKLRQWVNSDKTADQIPVSALFVCDLLIKKNAKYKDAWKKFGIYSVIIDLTQKLQRINGMTWDGEKQEWKMSAAEMFASIEEEGSIFDTIRDVAGYAILALALFQGANEARLIGARNMLQRLAA